MPPSPAMRCSPGREPRADNHKRGRSLESGILFKERDDDLALFNEVQTQERDNFLLQSNDDFEDTFTTKLRHFSDYKHGLHIPARGESSDLLNAEEEKNDYEWLITPPDTPLFPSLDDDVPQVNLVQRGRPRTQPISISRSSTMEKSHRSSRGSASPNRLSTSPRSSNPTFQTRGHASSAPSSSPPAILRPNTGSRRPSPPSSKPSTPLPRASTPNPRRLSTGSTNTSGVRGISPVKTSRGNSTSPKVRAWQSSIPGFSNEAPPNLRTSLADRPASYVRGSSPASRNSRQSMSPTPSRSISSSHSHDRDRFSSHSKGSFASSAEDDAESLPPITVSSSERSKSRKVGGFPNNKASISKKPSRIIASSSAPKRSFDLALRQMDQRKGPQNMFRPLLSSVPSSTFYAGKSTTAQRTMISRNSSITTSSNASSDLGTGGAHDIEVTELNQDDATSECVKVPNHDVEDEIFLFEKTDASNEGSPIVNRGDFNGDINGFENLGDIADSPGFDESNKRVDFLDIDNSKDMLLCSRCNCSYTHVGSIEEDVNLCETCRKSTYSPLTIIDPVTTMSGKDNESFKMQGPQMAVIESQDLTLQPEDLVKNGQSTYAEPIWNFLSENSLPRQQSEDQESPKVNDQVKSQHVIEQIQHNIDFPKSKVESLEGAGISILLKRSSSIKGPVVRSRNFSASSISYDDLSYVRGSVSASSSVDFGPAKNPDTRFQRQSSSRKSDMENYKIDPIAKHQRSGSSLSGTSSHAFHPPSIETSTLENEDVTITEGIENDDDTNFQTTIVLNSDLSTQSQTAVNSGENLSPKSSKYEEPVSFQKVEDMGNDTDVVEVPLNAISGEFDHICSSSPASQCDDVSQSSTSSIEELRDPAGIHEDIAVSAMDVDTSNHASSFLDESLVLVRGEGGIKGRSLTLEEATETILFCSSIVHNLAYEAATIAIDNENPQPPSANTASWPLIPAVKKTENFDKNTSKRPSKSQKHKPKKAAETDTTGAHAATTGENPDDIRKPRIVFPNNEENTKPPKLESKCNCTIM